MQQQIAYLITLLSALSPVHGWLVVGTGMVLKFITRASRSR